MRARLVSLSVVAAIALASATSVTTSSPTTACSSIAPSFPNAVLGAQAIARVTVTSVEPAADGGRYDLRVDRALKGDLPDRILRWDPEAYPGTCDDGWGAGPGDRAYLFLHVLQPWGTVQDLRLVWLPSYPYDEQMSDLDATTDDGVDRAILALAPDRGRAVPSLAFVADGYRGTDTAPDPDGGERSAMNLTVHTDGSLSLQAYVTLARPAVARAVVRAGALATAGPALFRLPLERDGDGYHHGVRVSTDAFVPSSLAATAEEALRLIGEQGAVVELWADPDRRPDHPRVHGVLVPTALTPLELAGRDLPDTLPPTDTALASLADLVHSRTR